MPLIEKGGAFIADTARVMGDVTLGRGSSVWYGAVIRADMAPITVGALTNIQDLCVLHCDWGKDLVIGDEVTIGHHATVHGRKIGPRSLIGMGAILLGGAEIGEGCLIGGGALVREGQVVPPRSILVGVPGKIIGQTTDAQIADFVDRAKRYHEVAQRHARGEVN